MARYAQVLLKHTPKLMLQRMQVGFEKVPKLQLIPAFNAMDEKHNNLTCAANYVKDFWIEHLGEREKKFYNLVFQLHLRALLASRTVQEAQECNGLQSYLEELELDKASQKTVLLDEKYATDTL